MPTRIDATFVQCASEGRMAFMPFITAGDPDVATTGRLLCAMRDANVDLIELGIPYSDPIADGPVIQASYTRALDAGITVDSILDMLAGLKNDGLPPVLAMVSYAIIFRRGVESFVQTAADAGVAGLIVPDLPADEAEEFRGIVTGVGMDLVQLIAPTTTEGRTRGITQTSTGFLYCISVAGTTGVRRELPEALLEQLRRLRQTTSLPLAVGFGISSPEHVGTLEGVADGVIVGSAIVRRVAEAESADAAVGAVSEFCGQMAEAVRRTRPSPAGGE